MNRSCFKYVLLLLAMVVSQMAANAHMIDHMAVASLDCQTHIHHTHDDSSQHHHHHESSFEDCNSDTTSDCSIYHAYTGANGLAPNSTNATQIQSQNVLYKLPLCEQLVAQALTTQPIRGPPLYS